MQYSFLFIFMSAMFFHSLNSSQLTIKVPDSSILFLKLHELDQEKTQGCYLMRNVDAYKKILQDCSEQKRQLLKEYIEKGGDINACDLYEDSVLRYAVAAKLDDIVVVLVRRGVEVSKKRNRSLMNYGQTELGFAVSLGHVSIVRELAPISKRYFDLQDAKGNTALMSAILYHHVENKIEPLVGSLIRAGAHVDVRNHDQETALVLAAKNNYARVVFQLLLAGASMNVRVHGGIFSQYAKAIPDLREAIAKFKLVKRQVLMKVFIVKTGSCVAVLVDRIYGYL